MQDIWLSNLIGKWTVFFSNLPAPYRSIGPKSYHIEFNPRMRTRAGLCDAGKNLIQLNPHLFKSEAQLESVFVHELCHLAISRRWPYARSHGMRWQKLMALSGFTPERCHNLDVEPGHLRKQRLWPVKCLCREHSVTTVTFNRLKRGVRYRCVYCKGPLHMA